MFNLDNRDMSDIRGYPVIEEVITTSESKFPALIEVYRTLVILDHHELPVGKSFRILETAPLTPAKVLLAWIVEQIDEID